MYIYNFEIIESGSLETAAGIMLLHNDLILEDEFTKMCKDALLDAKKFYSIVDKDDYDLMDELENKYNCGVLLQLDDYHGYAVQVLINKYGFSYLDNFTNVTFKNFRIDKVIKDVKFWQMLK